MGRQGRKGGKRKGAGLMGEDLNDWKGGVDSQGE